MPLIPEPFRRKNSMTKSNRIGEILTVLDEKEMRWLELSEIDS